MMPRLFRKSLNVLKERTRATLLERNNLKRCRDFVARLDSARIPTYIVITPHVTHLGPLAAANHTSSVQPVFVANGIADADIEWLLSRSPDIPVLRLKTSLRGRLGSLLTHGTVIDTLAKSTERPFCIQDADCFVTDAGFWDSMKLDEASHYASGPFRRDPTAGNRPKYPETFLVLLNAKLMSSLRRAHGVSATTKRPNRRARRILEQAGYPSGVYLETLKPYYDTLQQYWVAASHSGYSYNFVAGEGKDVFHVGGTSYLYEDFGDLTHWDYWALNVQYFHLRLLELPACARFRGRFGKLFEFHGSVEALLVNFPEFAAGWRIAQSETVLQHALKTKLYDGTS
jgi:hypothetical protein